MPPIALLALLLAPIPAPESDIVIVGRPSPPFISPMGEPFRTRSSSKDAFFIWFAQADRNRDGGLTHAEAQADAERFFARLDDNQDGQILPDELVQYEWEIAPEIQVGSKLKRPRSETAAKRDRPSTRRRGERSEDPYDPDGLQGAARYALLNMPQPVAAADTDFNRAVSLSEFRQAATHRFQLLDSSPDGTLTLAELEARLPQLPPPGKRVKRRPDAPDARVGAPLPPAQPVAR